MIWEMPQPRWDTTAGRLLDRFLEGVAGEIPDFREPVTVFGSAAIQLCFDDRFVSANVDIMVFHQSVRLRELAQRLGVGRSGKVGSDYGLQICPPALFLSTPHYLQRAWMGERHGMRVVVPHVRDILIGKLHRFREVEQDGLTPKDRRAFERVRELTGGRPSEGDLLEDLQLCGPALRIPGDGTVNNFRLNVLDVFRTVYGRALDIEAEVLEPARAAEEGGRSSGFAVREALEGLSPDRD